MGRLRIIAGRLRGRRIEVPPGSTRPTAERTREALFSILAASLEGVRVLDAYAGSGALGFEALSRGARQVVFLESDPRAVRTLLANAEGLGVTAECTLLRGAVLRLLSAGRVPGPFEVVLADPPYAAEERGRFLELAAAVLAPDGRIVLERDSADGPATGRGLVLARSARYGRASLDFYSTPRE